MMISNSNKEIIEYFRSNKHHYFLIDSPSSKKETIQLLSDYANYIKSDIDLIILYYPNYTDSYKKWINTIEQQFNDKKTSYRVNVIYKNTISEFSKKAKTFEKNSDYVAWINTMKSNDIPTICYIGSLKKSGGKENTQFSHMKNLIKNLEFGLTFSEMNVRPKTKEIIKSFILNGIVPNKKTFYEMFFSQNKEVEKLLKMDKSRKTKLYISSVMDMMINHNYQVDKELVDNAKYIQSEIDKYTIIDRS